MEFAARPPEVLLQSNLVVHHQASLCAYRNGWQFIVWASDGVVLSIPYSLVA